MKAATSPARSAFPAPSARAQAVAILAGALVAILLKKAECGVPSAPSRAVKRRKFAEKPNGCASAG